MGRLSVRAEGRTALELPAVSVLSFTVSSTTSLPDLNSVLPCLSANLLKHGSENTESPCAGNIARGKKPQDPGHCHAN